ncbi:MAG: hypothetical protein ACXWLH_00885 [Candidatus Saccharimonadales bacterium]
MGEQKNTVIINGKIYDSVSGVVLSAPKPNQLVSDFIRAPKQMKPAKSSRSTHHLAHHKPQKSITLKRFVASRKPALTTIKSMPLSGRETVTASAEKLLLSNGNSYSHAKTVAKSSAISRFSYNGDPAPQHLPLAVKPAPQVAPAYKPPLPKADFSSSQDIFSAALNNAESHNQAPVKVTKRKHRIAKKLGVSNRAANVVAIVFVSLAIGGLVAYQNASGISMHYAAARSGLISASLPAFQPAGFSLDKHVAASPGLVVLNFHSNSDTRAFMITQASSNWNSQTLADSFLAGKQSRRFDQPDGKTIYIYDGANATWVDGGIWYRIEGKSSLTADQLLKIADSF